MQLFSFLVRFTLNMVADTDLQDQQKNVEVMWSKKISQSDVPIDVKSL